MNKTQFKNILTQYAKGMIDRWFDTGSVKDVLCKATACTLINANIDKYDNYLEYICDANGQVCINDFIDNLIDNFAPYQIDLTQYDLPFLPNKILLIGKQDLILLKNMCIQQTTKQDATFDDIDYE